MLKNFDSVFVPAVGLVMHEIPLYVTKEIDIPSVLTNTVNSKAN